jgi:hypothetical protein
MRLRVGYGSTVAPRLAVRFGLLVALGAGCALPATALAAKEKAPNPGPVKIRTATASGSGNEAVISATAVCPKKTTAVGGGFVTAPGFTVPVQVYVFESQRASRRSWRASAQIGDNSAPSDVGTVTASVYCRSGIPKVSARSATVPTPVTAAPTTGPTVTATCPKGKKAVAGGFLTSPVIAPGTSASTIFVTDSLRASKATWSNRVLIGGEAGSLTTYVYCAKGKAPRAVQATGPTLTASFAEAGATATCTGKRNPVAGGFSQNAAAGGSGATTGLFITRESHAVGKGWVATGSHVFPQPTALTSIAYCG